MRSQKSGDKGFTLFEILIVLTIIGIFLGFVIPKFHDLEQASLKASARQIANLASYASNEAVSRRQPYILHIDMHRGEYWLTTTEHRQSDGGKRLITKKRLPEGIKFISQSVTAPPLIDYQFTPYGFRDEALIQLSDRHQRVYEVFIPAVGERFTVRIKDQGLRIKD
ncbi:MAG: prepilin-type N-terminal cleavage/methylation domain-containing protein [Nitrospirota bacterium]